MSLPVPAKLFAIGLLCLCCRPARAMDTVYLDPAEFLARYLPGCTQQSLWLDAQARSVVERLVDHPFPGVRVRYCGEGDRTGWILDEVGKTEPITSGIIIDGGRIESVRVLVFRESRGSEVHRNAFTRQYENAGLDSSYHLDRPIDGITGATLSVYALNRQVKLALYLDRLVRERNR